jgi:hypothetical protein
MQKERVNHNSIVKPERTWWQDQIFLQIAQLSLSPYVDVRKFVLVLFMVNSRASQVVLYGVVKRFKKWAPLILPFLLKSLESSDIETVKGSLHTLRLSTIEHKLARNWEFAEKYVLSVFEAWKKFDRVWYLG